MLFPSEVNLSSPSIFPSPFVVETVAVADVLILRMPKRASCVPKAYAKSTNKLDAEPSSAVISSTKTFPNFLLRNQIEFPSAIDRR